MKKRSSVEKSEWNTTREGWYRSECNKMAFKMGFDLIERDEKIYKNQSSEEELFCDPAKSKTLWFETWRYLKKMNLH